MGEVRGRLGGGWWTCVGVGGAEGKVRGLLRDGYGRLRGGLGESWGGRGRLGGSYGRVKEGLRDG